MDGAGSGLDADLLDGLQGSAYLLKTATFQTITGDIDITGALGVGGLGQVFGNFIAHGNANVGIDMVVAGSLDIGTTSDFAGNVVMQSALDVTGAATFASTFYAAGTLNFGAVNYSQSLTTTAVVVPNTQFHGTSTPTSAWFFSRYSADATGPLLGIGKSRGATIGTQTTVSSGDTLGNIVFFGNNGTTMREGARIAAISTEAFGASAYGTEIGFYTVPNGSTTRTQALLLGSDQIATAPVQVTTPKIRLTETADVSLSSTDNALQIGATASSNWAADANEIQFRNNGAAAACNINLGGGNVVLGSSASQVTMPGTLVMGGGASIDIMDRGTWVPTLTLTTNLAAGSGGTSYWIRFGNYVWCWGSVTLDPTASGAVNFNMDLPVASNFAGSNEAHGTGVIYTGSGDTGTFGFASVGATNDFNCLGSCLHTASRTYKFQVGYIVV